MERGECMGGSRSPTLQRCSAGFSVYLQRVLEGLAGKFNTTSNYDTGCTSAEMHNATAQQPLTMVSPNSNLNIVLLQKKQYSSVSTMLFHSVVHGLPFIPPLADCDFQSRVNEAMDAFLTVPSGANGVQWYELCYGS
ncbi:hypothetical protein TNCV_4131791 [Trichonephila clavipes]|nr:hypothetical protein TNCV_4131791 [Trichonephila clavipes]